MFGHNWRPIVLIAGESCALIGAVVAGMFVRFGDTSLSILVQENRLAKGLLIVLVTQITLYYRDLYDLRAITGIRDLTTRLLEAIGTTSLLLATLYFLAPDLIVGRGVFLISAAFIVSFVVGWRIAFAWLTRRVSPRERLLLVGTSAAAVDLARELFERRQELGVEIVGFVDPDPARLGAPLINPGVIGTIDDIPSLVNDLNVDRVVVSLSDARGKLPMDRLLTIRLENGVAFDHLASVYEQYTGKIALENLRPSWLIFSEGFRKTRMLLAAKRVVDVLFSTVGLLIGFPLMVLVGIAVKLTSAGPLLYHQTRVGLHGRQFRVHKFRTMRVDAESSTGPVWSTANDPRVTPVGNFLRRTRLDEMPQLWNVLTGEMSFVGPRPERPEFVQQLTKEIPFYGQRHVVKPGLTGWAQIRYTYGATVEDAIQKLQYDLYYIKNMAIALDVVIVVETIKTVIMRKGAR
jgi:sugar transferase (PEP-CTERM system associated)